MRISSGIYRNRKIATPGGTTHPMGERERLALFNMIAEYLPGARVLDAFAGSGALGIEALSREAVEVVFVEKNRHACQVIRENLRDLGVDAEIYQGDVSKYTTDKMFEIILADPPYDNFNIAEVAHLLQFLKIGGIFVLSHPEKAPELSNATLLKTRKYAGAQISVYIKR